MTVQAAHIARVTDSLAEGGELSPYCHDAATSATGLTDGTASILAIDPGTLESGWAILVGRRVDSSGIVRNEDMLRAVIEWDGPLAIEMIASYGMPVGAEVFETCVWIGRFVQAYRYSALARLIYRKDVKLYLCGTTHAKDPHIRQALIDLIGPQGTKKAPGPTYGVRSHAWAALGVAVTALRLERVPHHLPETAVCATGCAK